MPVSLAMMQPAPPYAGRTVLPSVLDVTDFYSDTTSGGVRTYLHAKATYLERMGVRHAIVVPGERTEVTEIGATRVYRVKGPTVALSRAYRIMLSARELSRVLREERPDVIEVGSPFIVPHLVRRAGGDRCATIGFYHADLVRTFAEPYVPNRLAAPVRVVARMAARRFVRRVYGGFDATVAASLFVADDLRALGVPNVRTVGLGVDLDTFRPLDGSPAIDRTRLGIAPEVPLGIYTGRFCAEKRLDVILAGHERIPLARRPHLLLVGGGPHAERLRRLAAERPRLTITEYVHDRSALAHLVASADFYVAPGPGETFGLSIAEAMACGLPVVAVRRGAAPDRLEGSGVGEQYEHGDPASAAAALLTMAGRLSPRLRLQARAHAERSFDWDKTFGHLLALYQELVAVGRS
jgi:alpha-1,6-mannosyltransferase